MSLFTDTFKAGMIFFYELTGSWGVAIILLTLAVRLLILPLTIAQTRSSRKMQALQPEIEKIKQKYKKDPQKQNQAIMELWRTHQVNPMSGCLVALIQLPFLWGIFAALSATPFTAGFLWIPDLSKPDPLYILPILAGVTTIFTITTATMNPNDKTQRAMMYIMPVFVGWVAVRYAAGLSLYWVVQNIFSVVQQALQRKPAVQETPVSEGRVRREKSE